MRSVYFSKRALGGDLLQLGKDEGGNLGIYNASRGRWCAVLSPTDLAAELEQIGQGNLTNEGLAWLLKYRHEQRQRGEIVPLDIPARHKPAVAAPGTVKRKRRMGRRTDLQPSPG